MEGGNCDDPRRIRTPSPHWIVEEQMAEDELSDDDDLMFTYSYSVDHSPIQISAQQRLIDLDSYSDEEELRLIDTGELANDDSSFTADNRPPPQHVLMIPALAEESNRDPPHLETKRRNSNLNGDRTYPSTTGMDDPERSEPSRATSPVKLTQRGNRLSPHNATLPPPISMRRVSSTPTKLKSPKFFSKSPPSSTGSPLRRLSGGSTIRAPTMAVSHLSNGYSLQRQISLPTRNRSPLLLPRAGFHDSVVSSPGSSVAADEEDMAVLAKELATPKSSRSNRIFRTVRSNSFRSPPSPQQQSSSTPKSESSFTGAKNVLHDSDKHGLHRIDTGRTDSDDEDTGGLELTNDPGRRTSKQLLLGVPPLQEVGEDGIVSDESDSTREAKPFLQRRSVRYVMYLSTFACFGTIVRVFVGRFFGLDCELQNVHDWLSVVSKHVCVTATGRTEQRGGALFSDLPANVLGSFVMGLLTVLKPSVWPPIPWLHADHPLQKNEILHVAIKTGMCGSLTTFASWNAQMVVMLDGSQTLLGSQIAAALSGYALGVIASLASFVSGTHVSAWLNNWQRRRHSDAQPSNRDDDDDEEQSPPSVIAFPKTSGTCCGRHLSKPSPSRLWSGIRLPLVILGVLMSLFLVGDLVFDSPFYRSMWVQVLWTPPGALLRWALSARLNGTTSSRRGWEWLPLGTFTANMVGSVVSILMLALEFRYFPDSNDWSNTKVSAIRVGFAGSLSTVSTFVMELVTLSQRFPHHAKPYYYCCLMITSAMALSLLVYIPIVRF